MRLSFMTDDQELKTPHGFFTRQNGCSTRDYETLNCGLGSDDERANVLENRARVARALGVQPTHLLGCHQVHSADVIEVRADNLHVFQDQTAERPKADGLVTTLPDVALSILTADCMPVLFADLESGVIGAAHAGWRGAFSGVLEQTVLQMEALGASREAITALIGPCISQKNYEVGEEFLETFLVEDPEFLRFFVPAESGKYLFDLPSFGLYHLRRWDLKSATWVGHCTYGDPEKFFSYRRSTHEKAPDYGRLISAITLPRS